MQPTNNKVTTNIFSGNFVSLCCNHKLENIYTALVHLMLPIVTEFKIWDNALALVHCLPGDHKPLRVICGVKEVRRLLSLSLKKIFMFMRIKWKNK